MLTKNERASISGVNMVTSGEKTEIAKTPGMQVVTGPLEEAIRAVQRGRAILQRLKQMSDRGMVFLDLVRRVEKEIESAAEQGAFVESWIDEHEAAGAVDDDDGEVACLINRFESDYRVVLQQCRYDLQLLKPAHVNTQAAVTTANLADEQPETAPEDIDPTGNFALQLEAAKRSVDRGDKGYIQFKDATKDLPLVFMRLTPVRHGYVWVEFSTSNESWTALFATPIETGSLYPITLIEPFANAPKNLNEASGEQVTQAQLAAMPTAGSS